FGLRITKTFTLKRHWYHIGLGVKITRLDPAAQAPFRYQIVCGRHLPIEGQWYATIYRNALAGFTEGGNFRRFYQDAGQVNYTQGSDRQVRSGDVRFRWGGVAVQYFASVLVVDDEQPEAAQNCIEYVRATAEEPKDSFDPDHLYLNDIAMRAISEALKPTA